MIVNDIPNKYRSYHLFIQLNIFQSRYHFCLIPRKLHEKWVVLNKDSSNRSFTGDNNLMFHRTIEKHIANEYF
jgi:hypothetical protein